MNRGAPMVSVLMTAYNREAFITAAIESVLLQTYNDFELVIVDDGSSDQTVERARAFSGDPRVRIHVNPANLGDYPNRNRAASLATGRYLKYADSDDLLQPHCLERFVDAMEAAPEAALALTGRGRTNWFYPVLLEPADAYREEFLGAERIMAESSTGSMIRKEAFDRVGGFSGARHHGDFELWLKLCARHPLLLVGPGLVCCRRHLDSETGVRAQRPQVFLAQRDMVLGRLADPGCPLSGAERDLAIRVYRSGYLRRQLTWLRSGRKSLRFFREAIRGLGVSDWLDLRRVRRDPGLSRRWEVGPDFRPGRRRLASGPRTQD